MENEMTFWDHLEVLRHLIFRVLLVWIILGIAYFIAMPFLFDEVILAPCKHNFFFYNVLAKVGEVLGSEGEFFNQTSDIELINIKLASQFLIHMSTAFWMSVVTATPYLIYEIWRFISPALYKTEKKGVRRAMLGGTLLFFAGVAIGYFMVFPLTLRFLVNYQISSIVQNQLSLSSYIDNFMMLILLLGLTFELPILTWILSLFGLVNRNLLRKFRKHAIIIIVTIAAIITPTGDPFTLAIVSVPLCLLYELSIFLVKK